MYDKVNWAEKRELKRCKKKYKNNFISQLMDLSGKSEIRPLVLDIF